MSLVSTYRVMARTFTTSTLYVRYSHRCSLCLQWPVCSISSCQTTSVLSYVWFNQFVKAFHRKATVINTSDPSRFVWVFKGPRCRSGSRMVLMWLVKQDDRLVGVIHFKYKQAEKVCLEQKKSGSLVYLDSRRGQSVFSGKMSLLIQDQLLKACTISNF